MKELLTPVVIGLSFGNLWICALLVFTLQTTKKTTSIGYLFGRSSAIILLSIMISIIGKVLNIRSFFLQIISGVFLLIYTFFLILTHLINYNPNNKGKRNQKWIDSYNCNSDCHKCPASGIKVYSEACSSCNEGKTCLADSSEINILVKKKNVLLNKSGFIFGFLLGVFRGVLLCSKLILLVPIILSSSITYSIAASFLFCVASSIYPILGFMFGGFALKFIKFKRYLIFFSCFIMTAIGIWYIYLGINIFLN